MVCAFYFIVSCQSLTDPSNGMINCSLGDDEVPSYEDTCSFTCDTGYELTDNDTRTCQSDGTWSGNSTMCEISKSVCNITEYVYSMICMIKAFYNALILIL